MEMTHTAATETKPYAVDRAISGSFDLDSTDGFSWAEARIVQIDNPPHEAAFDTDRFYKIDATLARPIKQTYQTYDDEVVMKKPADELRDAAWSADNAPVTLGHPSSQIVDSVDLVHGFVRGPHWDSSDESLEASVYIPVSDTRAKSWIEDNDGVSIGFWNEPEAPPERIAEDVDRIQTNLYVDHVAIVDTGRCSREDGCGLAVDAANARAIRGFAADTGAAGCSAGPCSCGLHATTDKTEAREARNEYRFETRAAAANAAEELDCADGDSVEAYTHSHEKDNGVTVYMPCADHGEFRIKWDEKFGDEYKYDADPASTEGNAENIDISSEQVDAIKTVRDEHDEMDGSEISPNLSTLKKVYRRGAGAWETSHAPGASQQQWALARVKEFLKDLRNGNALNSGADNDLAPDGYSPPSNDAAYGVDESDRSVSDIDLTVPDGAQSAAQAFLDANDEGIIPDDCGTGEGTESAKMIADGEVTPDRLESDIAPYLNSHEEDTSTDTHPSNWSMDEESDTPWTDCGDAQYAAWGWHSLTDWARRKADAIKRARGDDPVYDTDRPTEDRHWTDMAKVGIDHQMARRQVSVSMATAPAPFYIVLHDEGAEHTRQNISVGPQLGRDGPYEAHAETDSVTVEFDEPIREARTVYAVLYYADESGDLADPIESKQGFIFDSATVMPQRSMRRSLSDAADTDVVSAVNSIMSGDGSYQSVVTIDARSVAGVTFRGVRDGKLDESEIPNDDYEEHYLYPADIKSDSSYAVVDAEGYLRTGNVAAAHQLGARGGVDSDEHDEKIKRLNDVTCESDVGCAVDSLTEDSTTTEPSDEHTDSIMTDDTDGSPLNVGDLTIDAIAAEHDAVAELREENTELEDRVEVLTDKVDSLEEEVESYRADEKQDLVDEITSLTDAWDEDDLMEMDLDAVEEKLELARDIYEDVDAATVDTGAGGDVAGSSSGNGNAGSSSQYEPGQVYDLADTA